MLGTTWTEPRHHPHHRDMLLARVRRSAPARVRTLAVAARPPGRDASGISALYRLERDGLLHHVTPLGKAARREVSANGRSGQVGAALRAAAREHDAARAETGYILIHLKNPAQRAALHRKLAADRDLASVSRVAARYIWAASNPAGGFLPPERMWNHARIQLAPARKLASYRSPGNIRVAVLDSGVQIRHPSLKGRVHDYVHSYGRGHRVKSSALDIVGHGTHIAGILNAAREDTLGIEGIAQCRLTVMKVFDDRLDADPAARARIFLVNPLLYRWALGECLARRFDVVNLSLGGPSPPDPHEAAVLKALLARGTTIVAAMGNALKQRTRPVYPAASPGVIAVGAVGPDDVVTPFSCRGRHIALCAPGVAIWSTLPTFPGEFGFLGDARPGERRSRARPLARNTRYDAWPGTSGACPHVTAAVAILLASKGRMSPARVKQRLMRSADRVTGMHGKRFDPKYGAGRLNLRRLLENE